jgi:hypothetical protein
VPVGVEGPALARGELAALAPVALRELRLEPRVKVLLLERAAAVEVGLECDVGRDRRLLRVDEACEGRGEARRRGERAGARRARGEASGARGRRRTSACALRGLDAVLGRTAAGRER